MTAQAKTASSHPQPPHGIAADRWARVIEAFRFGGYVSAREADAYLLLESGTTKKHILAGDLPFSPRPWGTSTRYLVHAWDAEDLLGVPRDRRVIQFNATDLRSIAGYLINALTGAFGARKSA